MNTPKAVVAADVARAHALYCRLTGQTLRLEYDRERAWYELLRVGFTLEELEQVIRYLQREIRRERRNVGALKLRNLLQPDLFEEDLNISRVKLRAPPAPPPSPPLRPPVPPTAEVEQRRTQRAAELALFRQSL